VTRCLPARIINSCAIRVAMFSVENAPFITYNNSVIKIDRKTHDLVYEAA
jgi:hypothetical protein